MALRKKGSRKITIAGVVYRWVVAKDKKGLHFVIEHEDSPGQRLVMAFDLEQENGEATVVAPADVEKIVQMGLEKGWEPTKKTAQLHLGHANDVFYNQ